jgi:hypothetical protein
MCNINTILYNKIERGNKRKIKRETNRLVKNTMITFRSLNLRCFVVFVRQNKEKVAQAHFVVISLFITSAKKSQMLNLLFFRYFSFLNIEKI